MIRNLLALTGVIALAAISAVTLQAQDYFSAPYAGEPPAREAVSIRDLDLTTNTGIRKLERRINRAIDRVCPAEGIGALVQTRSIRQCREDAVASVRPQVDRAVAAAEERQYVAYQAPGRSHGYALPPRDRYAMRAPAPDHAWREDERGWREDSAEYRWRANDRGRPSALAEGKVALAKAAPPSSPPPPGGRLVKRTIVTTTVTNTVSRGTPPTLPTVVTKTVVEKPVALKRTWRSARAAAYARRPAVAGSWLPPVAWAASDRAAVSAFRSGRLTRWRLTDRNGIARSGFVTVSPARWVAGAPCRNVQTVKTSGGRRIVVASGMRCLAGGRLVNRAA